MSTSRRRAYAVKALTRRAGFKNPPIWFPSESAPTIRNFMRQSTNKNRARLAQRGRVFTVVPSQPSTGSRDFHNQRRLRRDFRLRHGRFYPFVPDQIVVTPPAFPPPFIRAGLRAHAKPSQRHGLFVFPIPISAADPRVIEPLRGFLVTDGQTFGVLITDGKTYTVLLS